MMKANILVLMAMLLISACSTNVIDSKGRQVTDNNQRKLILKAQSGDLKYQLDASHNYSTGSNGFPKDKIESFYWRLKAASQNDVGSQYFVGLSYYNGWNVPKDIISAIEWLERAGNQKKQFSTSANALLGKIYFNGEGVAKDYKKAYSRLSLASLNDLASGYYLGFLYENGLVVDKNLELANINYYRSIVIYSLKPKDCTDREGISPKECERVALSVAQYFDGKDVDRQMLALQQAVAYGNLWAKWKLGVMIIGNKIPNDKYKNNTENAEKMLLEAASGGYYPAQIALAQLYLESAKFNKDTRKSLQWAVAASNNKNKYEGYLLLPEVYIDNITEELVAVSITKASDVYSSSDANASVLRISNINEKGYITKYGLSRYEIFLPKDKTIGYLEKESVVAIKKKEVATPASSVGSPTAVNDMFPRQPSKVPGKTSCNTRCMNGDCYRTYDNGKKIRFRAEQKFDPFTSQFTWDAGSC